MKQAVARMPHPRGLWGNPCPCLGHARSSAMLAMPYHAKAHAAVQARLRFAPGGRGAN